MNPEDKISEASKAYLVNKDAVEGLEDAIEDTLLYAPEQDQVAWSFQVEEAGFYQISVRYYPIKGKSSSIERTLLINGKVPFEGASFVFHRIWDNNPESMQLDENQKYIFKQDVNGNDIKPNQIEKPAFRKVPLRDDLGYVTENYRFYFPANDSSDPNDVNTIALIAIKECILIDQIYIESVTKTPTYSEYKAQYANLPNTPVILTGWKPKAPPANLPQRFIRLRPFQLCNDSNSQGVKTQCHRRRQVEVLGDWISWEIEVPETVYIISQ